MGSMNLRLSLIGSGRPGSHLFGAEGGVFGRSQKCDWVLPDEERILSSIHGRVIFKNGEFMLLDESTNGTFVNGLPEPLGRGNSVVLANGTRIGAGRYTIEVQLVRAEQDEARPRPAAFSQAPTAVTGRNAYPVQQPGRNAEDALHDRSELGSLWAPNSQDPLSYITDPVDAGIAGSLDRQGGSRDPVGLPAHAIGSTGLPSFRHDDHSGHRQPPSVAEGEWRDTLAVSVPQDLGIHDPLQALGHDQASPNTLAGLVNPGVRALQPRPAEVDRRTAQPAGKGPTAAAIPEDFLSRLGTGRKSGVSQASQNTPLQTPPTAVPPLAQMPSAPAPGTRIPEEFDPFAAKPAQSAAGQPPLPPQLPDALPPVPADPQASVSSRPQHEKTVRPNGLSPALMADLVEFDSSASGVAGQSAAQSDGPVDALGALKARREQRKATMLKKAQTGLSLPLPPALQPGPAPASPMIAEPSSTDAARITGSRASSGNGTVDAALLSAFLEGMGFEDVDLPPGDHGRLMREAGGMVKAMATGLILLLSARQMVKSEFRMEETQIQPEENNPFKFFKVAELALDELFLTRKGGFQGPSEAAKSAFEDLEQHTMLTMSAMQRAIKLIFERLSPDALNREAGDESALRIRGLGAGRKGKLETFAESHEKMSRNIDAVARQVIAEAFAQVQEEHARSRAQQHWRGRV